eukprot:6476786-Amphidinium_carterae.1
MENNVEQIVDVPVSLTLLFDEQKVDVPLTQTMENNAEQIVEVPVPLTVKDVVRVPSVITHAILLSRWVEQIVDVPVPQIVEEHVEPHFEQKVDVPWPQNMEELAEQK